ncbi:sugar porter family MFS transporter [Pollutibacter soli]|uniref:sugar porter family MFS transporter n=1 Tax=Pollutibacter soli TaxID=3034157 RepID=UPI003013E178
MGYAVRIALIAALGGFLFGFETAVISGAEQTIQKLWELSASQLGLTVASSLFGTVLGSILAGTPAQKYGRKPVLFFIAFLYLFSAIGCASSQGLLMFVFFRFIGGVAVGASSVVGPMYISEIAPAKLRGRLAASFQLNIVLGIFVAYVSNYLLAGGGEESWRWMLGIMVVPAVLFTILIRFIPESPRWLILNGKTEEAIPILKRIGEMDVNKEIAEIQSSISDHKESLFQKKYRKPLLYAIILAMFNQLSGINAIIYYAKRIFAMAGFDDSSAYLQSIYIGTANLVFTLIAMAVIDRFGRKKLLLIGSAGMVIFLTLTALAFRDTSVANPNVVWYLIGFIGFFGFSQGAVIWVFISEIFPNSVRSQGGSAGSFTHWIMAAIISYAFPVIVNMSPQGGFYSFVFYSVMMALQFLFVWKFLPETKGKSLEKIQEELGIPS